MTYVQRKILNLMAKHLAEEAGVPTLAWIAGQLQRSKTVVFEHLQKMVAAGLLKTTAGRGKYRRYCPADNCPCCGKPLERS